MQDSLSRVFDNKRKSQSLSEQGRLKIAAIKKQAEEEKKQEWKQQMNRREQDLAKERQKIIEKKPQLKLQPPGHAKDRNKGEVERQAVRNLADTNRKALANIDKKHAKEIEKITIKEKVPIQKEFNRPYGQGEGRIR